MMLMENYMFAEADNHNIQSLSKGWWERNQYGTDCFPISQAAYKLEWSVFSFWHHTKKSDQRENAFKTTRLTVCTLTRLLGVNLAVTIIQVSLFWVIQSPLVIMLFCLLHCNQGTVRCILMHYWVYWSLHKVLRRL